MQDYEITYKKMIARCAEHLEQALREAPVGVYPYVLAIPTTETDNGKLIVKYDNQDFPPNARVIRPCNNGASTYDRWIVVPFSGLFSVLYAACRREPILPIH